MFTPILLFAAAIAPSVSAESFRSRTINPNLNAALKMAATNYDRWELLQDKDWVYDFKAHPNYNSPTGAVIVADAASFTAATGHGMTISILRLAACGMLPPHLHPRAANFVTAITGNTTTWMIGENGVRTVETILTPMKMTIFPAGSVHAMQNHGTSNQPPCSPFSISHMLTRTSDCEPALLVSALNSDDTGTTNLLPALWTMPQDIIQAAFGDAGMETQQAGRGIPPIGTGAILGSAECIKKCGINHGKQ